MSFAIDEALEAIAARTAHSFQIGCWTSGRTEVRGIGPRADADGCYANGSYRHLLGCITKMMTATLVARAAADGLLRFTDECLSLAPSLASDARHEKLLRGVLVSHLLEHSHGIDDSGFDMAPFAADGSVDLSAVLNSVHLKRIAAAGEHFHYGRFGSWVAAAVLETLRGRSYTRLLREMLSAAGEHRAADVSWPNADLCPGNGGDLRMGMSALLDFVSLHLPSQSDRAGSPLAPLREHTFDTPGWFPFGRSLGLGLSDFGGGWYGHNSIYRDSSLLVRFNPATDIAFAIGSDSPDGSQIAIDALDILRPERSAASAARLLSKDRWLLTGTDPYAGRFANARHQIDILAMPGKPLLLRDVAGRHGGRDSATARQCLLRPAQKHIFFPASNEFRDTPFLQFLGLAGDGRYQYLQNGKQVFRRVNASVPPRADADSIDANGRRFQPAVLGLHRP